MAATIDITDETIWFGPRWAFDTIVRRLAHTGIPRLPEIFREGSDSGIFNANLTQEDASLKKQLASLLRVMIDEYASKTEEELVREEFREGLVGALKNLERDILQAVS